MVQRRGERARRRRGKERKGGKEGTAEDRGSTREINKEGAGGWDFKDCLRKNESVPFTRSDDIASDSPV